MIRHGSSFFFSLIFHGILVLILFFTWRNIPSLNKVNCDEKVYMQLCNIIVEKPKPLLKPKTIPRLTQKTKPIAKKITKPKAIVKKIEVVKEVPIIMPKVVKKEQEIKDVKEEIVEEKIVRTVQTIEKEIIEEETIVEDKEAKQVRLEKEYKQANEAQIRKLIQDNLYYPIRARKSKAMGTVKVKFKISTDGKVYSIEIISSKEKILSRAAIKTIEDLSGKYPKPKEELILHIPINYSLHE